VSKHIVYIGIGSNLAEPLSQVRQAINQLMDLKQSEFIAGSSLYTSKPMGPQDQPDYVNAVVSIRTRLTPIQLLDELQGLETEHGRLRQGPRWGARTLDLDILLFDEKTINSDRLIVPHPGLHVRPFVLYPLHEINAELYIPGKGLLTDLLAHCPPDGLKKIKT